MALLSQMIRSRAITGSTDASTFKWIAGRQGGRWAEQHVHAAFGDRVAEPAPSAPAPAPAPPAPAPAQAANPAESVHDLTELHRRGVVTDAEFDELLGRLQA
ncbi:MAG TPA: hypothetical protein VF032_21960 [Thermoleophilaceae bacterium]